MRKRDILYTVLFIIVLGLFILSIIHTSLGITYPLLVVKSGSMEPVIKVGDIIIVVPVNYEEIYASPTDGDVIVFYRPGEKGKADAIIVHRAIKKVEGGIITKGDANAAPDYWGPVPPDHIIGRWTGWKIPSWTQIGYVSLFLRGEYLFPWGPLLIGFLIVVNIILILRDIAGKRRETGNNSEEATEKHGE